MIEIEFCNVGKSVIDRQTSQLRTAVSLLNTSIRSSKVVSIIVSSSLGRSVLLNMSTHLHMPRLVKPMSTVSRAERCVLRSISKANTTTA